tara:strand:- start:2145 stop:3074 length:930 start_codon:yes stop_codon:yes gene_type:complete
MKLSNSDETNLLKRLPDLKLSYENIHNKVFSDLYFIIPKGKKHLVWFTYIKDRKVCVFIEINPGSNKLIKKLYIVPQKFNKTIVLGTIFYGTIIGIDEKQFFSIENIHFYKGRNVEHKNEIEKLNIINHILSHEIKQIIIGNNGIGFGLPVITDSFEDSISIAKTLPYNIYSIQNRNLNSNTNHFNSTLYKNTDYDNLKRVFSIQADLQNDIYNLYIRNKHNNLEIFDIAYIPDYKTSIMMNNLFRNIKENYNLDALEESDDEEEFENIDDDKFVNLNKCVIMECILNKKFNKYVPIKVINNRNIESKK